MKKLFHSLFKRLSCTPDNWRYWKRIGGKWYKVGNVTGQSGTMHKESYWTQQKPEKGVGIAIIKKEHYPLKSKA